MDCENRGKAASATAKALEDLGKLRETLAFADGATFETCVQEACGRFYKLFRDRVLQLTHNFPEVCDLKDVKKNSYETQQAGVVSVGMKGLFGVWWLGVRSCSGKGAG